jgi:hypothetical protein
MRMTWQLMKKMSSLGSKERAVKTPATPALRFAAAEGTHAEICFEAGVLECLVEAGLPGLRCELLPALKRELTQDEYPHAITHMFELVADFFVAPLCASVIWTVYKRRFRKHVLVFVEGIDTAEKRTDTRAWFRETEVPYL